MWAFTLNLAHFCLFFVRRYNPFIALVAPLPMRSSNGGEGTEQIMPPTTKKHSKFCTNTVLNLPKTPACTVHGWILYSCKSAIKIRPGRFLNTMNHSMQMNCRKNGGKYERRQSSVNIVIHSLCVTCTLNLSSFICVLQIPQGQLHIAQVPQGEEVQITQDSEASVHICEIKRRIEKSTTPFLESFFTEVYHYFWAKLHISQPFYVMS